LTEDYSDVRPGFFCSIGSVTLSTQGSVELKRQERKHVLYERPPRCGASSAANATTATAELTNELLVLVEHRRAV
jgi:hypothetical protein